MTLRDMRGLSPGTRRNYVRVAGCLLHRKFTDGTFDLHELRPADVRQFFASKLDARRTSSNAIGPLIH